MLTAVSLEPVTLTTSLASSSALEQLFMLSTLVTEVT